MSEFTLLLTINKSIKFQFYLSITVIQDLFEV